MSGSVFQLHEVLPENNKGDVGYTEFDLVDFVCAFSSRKMLCNSLRFECDLRVQQNDTNLTVEDNVYLNHKIGGHGLISQITTEINSVGQIESINSYPKLVGMITSATLSNTDLLNGSKSCELRSPAEKYTKRQILGESFESREDTAIATIPNAISLKPIFSLNRSQGETDNAISYAKSGNIRISIQFSRVNELLYGAGVGSGLVTYKITNPRLVFTSIADDGKQDKLQMRVEYNIKTQVNSSLSNLGLKVPAVCNAVSIMFIKSAHESNPYYDDVAQEMPPNISRCDFNFNNSTNTYVTYTIRDKVELISRYLDSLSSSGHNQASLNLLSANKGFGIGLSFGEFIDLSRQAFNVQITSDVVSDDPYTAVFFFHSIASF